MKHDIFLQHVGVKSNHPPTNPTTKPSEAALLIPNPRLCFPYYQMVQSYSKDHFFLHPCKNPSGRGCFRRFWGRTSLKNQPNNTPIETSGIRRAFRATSRMQSLPSTKTNDTELNPKSLLPQVVEPRNSFVVISSSFGRKESFFL